MHTQSSEDRRVAGYFCDYHIYSIPGDSLAPISQIFNTEQKKRLAMWYQECALHTNGGMRVGGSVSSTGKTRAVGHTLLISFSNPPFTRQTTGEWQIEPRIFVRPRTLSMKKTCAYSKEEGGAGTNFCGGK